MSLVNLTIPGFQHAAASCRRHANHPTATRDFQELEKNNPRRREPVIRVKVTAGLDFQAFRDVGKGHGKTRGPSPKITSCFPSSRVDGSPWPWLRPEPGAESPQTAG